MIKLQQAILEEAMKLRDTATDVEETIGIIEDFLKRLRLLAVEVYCLESYLVNFVDDQLTNKQTNLQIERKTDR